MSIRVKFLRKIVRNIVSIILRTKGYIDFKIAVLLKRPYFGSYLFASQTWFTRRSIMRRILENELSQTENKDYKILEIGSWAGQSTLLWASVCKKYNKGKVFCIDTWGAAVNSPKKMINATKKDKIMKLFLHNIRTSGLRRLIIPIRGTSNEVFEILKENKFDFVYIDGDHSYKQFKRDLENYSKLCTVNGIVCGDDFEISLSDLDLDNAMKHSEEDFIEDTKTKEFFHPGIALGIKDVFKNVNSYNGFWAIRKSKKGWKDIDFTKFK
jgi:predicted O-methyltransferase YrrM